MISPYRVALIGTGAFANTHVEALRTNGVRVRLVAAVNKDAERGQAFCNTHNIPMFYPTTAGMLAAEKPNLVLICTPPHTHVELSIMCLEAGAHVLCEKPLCASLADFDRLVAAETMSGKTLSTVFQWRFGSAAQHLKRLMNNGELGRPLLAMCQTLWYRDMEYYGVAWRSKWETSLGGTTMGHGIHLMDLLLWLMGDWSEVQAVMGTLDHDIEVDDVSLAIVKFENGAMGSIANSAISPRQETYLRLDFQHATTEVKGLYSASNANWQFTAHDTKLQWAVPNDESGTLPAQIRALLDSLDKGERPLVSGMQARRIIEFTTSLYKAALTGQSVKRGSITPDDAFYHSMQGVTR